MPDLFSSDASVSFAAADVSAIASALDTVDASAARVSRTLSKTFADALINGKSFESTLSTIGQQLSSIALQSATKAAVDGIGSLLSSAFSSFSGAGGAVTAFAEGGIVAQPTFFGSGGGMGVMGEKGAEAIMPLARGPDGTLGVAASGQGGRPVAVTVNISTPDVQGFSRSEGQVSAALARAVARGSRSL